MFGYDPLKDEVERDRAEYDRRHFAAIDALEREHQRSLAEQRERERRQAEREAKELAELEARLAADPRHQAWLADQKRANSPAWLTPLNDLSAQVASLKKRIDALEQARINVWEDGRSE